MKAFKRLFVLVMSAIMIFCMASCTDNSASGAGLKTLVSVEKIKTDGLLDTYSFKFSDGTTQEFLIKNGADGENGKDGTTPHIGENGNWWIGALDTGVKAEGQDGAKGEPGEKGDNGAEGDDGLTPEIGENGNWWIGTLDTGVKAEGEKGDTVTISKIEKINTEGLVDTYTILLSDGTNFTFKVTNGKDGSEGKKGDTITVTSVEKTATDGLVDTYTITYSDNSKFYFTVTNGKDALTENKVTISGIEFVSNTDDTVTYKINYSDESSANFTLNTDGEAVSEAVAAYNSAVAQGYRETLDKWISDLVMETKENLLTSGSVLGAKTLGAAMPKILNSFNTYFKTNVNETHIKDIELENLVEGKYFYDNGSSTGLEADNAAYRYNKTPIPVEAGQILKIVNKETRVAYGHRCWVAFSGSTVVHEASGVDASCVPKFYCVPTGVDGVIITWAKTGLDGIAAIFENRISVSLSGDLDAYTVNTMINGAAGGGSGVIKDTEAEIIISTVLGKPSISTSVESLPKKQWLNLTDTNTVMNNKTLSFSAEFDGTLTADDSIWVGHGYTEYASSYVILTGTKLIVHEYYSATNNVNRIDVEHGLTIKDFVNITIDVGTNAIAKITIGTSTGMLQKNASWGGGRNGKVFAVSQTTDLTNVKMRWVCEGYSENIWLYGDSYFNVTDGSRWPSYMIKDGYVDHMMSGYPGMNTQTALEQFKIDITYGTPQYVVWCMGMNNGDGKKDADGNITDITVINSDWLSCTEEFLKICNEKGITPILATIPSTPTVLNAPKNDWVKASGYRYIDFARAVGGYNYDETLIGKEYTYNGNTLKNVTGNEWYTDMLYADLVHPAELGAKLLYTQFLIDFPEITEER